MNNNILVVDDEKEIRELLNINLINEGFNVFKAGCGKEALEIIDNEEINLGKNINIFLFFVDKQYYMSYNIVLSMVFRKS